MEGSSYRRIGVIGTTGSGKSTLAERISARLGLPFVELDSLYWQPNWRPASLEEMRAGVETALSSGSWVVAGNYHVVRDMIWPKAEALVWLDYGLPVIFRRLFVRTIRRSVLQEELWNGNRERFWWHLKFWSDESLFRWLLKTYWRRKRETPRLLAQPEHAHLKLIRLTSPRQAEVRLWWLLSGAGFGYF